MRDRIKLKKNSALLFLKNFMSGVASAAWKRAKAEWQAWRLAKKAAKWTPCCRCFPFNVHDHGKGWVCGCCGFNQLTQELEDWAKAEKELLDFIPFTVEPRAKA